jgi:amino acid adenylation domain-containing protein
MNLCDYLADSRQRFPDRVAVVDPAGLSLTYAELDDRSSRIAGYLRAAGVAEGDRVGIIAPKSADVVASLFGIMKAGAAYVPADYSAPAARNRTVLSDCAVTLAILAPGCHAVVGEWPTATPPRVAWLGEPPEGSGVPTGDSWPQVLAHDPLPPAWTSAPDALAYVLYTSGSTGVPKGVMLTQENATSFVDWCTREFAPTEQDRFSSHAPFHFDLSILDLYVPLKHGAALYLVSEEVGKAPQALAEFIVNNALTVWYSTPSILSLLAQFGDLDRHDCRTLRTVLFAGEVFPVKHLRTIVAHWPQATFFNLYGPTETNVCTFARIPSSIPEDRVAPYPIGPPCSHFDAMVLDDVDGIEVSGTTEGLLYMAGPALFPGYWGRPTDGLFIHRHGKRWYNTGDVVQDGADGYVYLGRRDRMVKRRGYRIELAEIERGLYQHPRVREAAVVSVPDPSAGMRIIAFIVATEGERPSIIEMKTFCGQALIAYINPDRFVFLDALPRTSTNKVDYQALIRSQDTPAPAPASGARG